MQPKAVARQIKITRPGRTLRETRGVARGRDGGGRDVSARFAWLPAGPRAKGGKAASHGYFMHCRSLEAAGHEHEPEPRLYSSATWAIGATGRVRLTKRGAPAAVRAGERAPQPLSYCLPHPVKEERCPCDPDEVIRSRSGRPRLSHRPRRPSGHRRRGPWGQGRGCTSFRALPIRRGICRKCV